MEAIRAGCSSVDARQSIASEVRAAGRVSGEVLTRRIVRRNWNAF